MKRLAMEKHSSLFGTFVSYEEKEAFVYRIFFSIKSFAIEIDTSTLTYWTHL
jgi:hypothetical protein